MKTLFLSIPVEFIKFFKFALVGCSGMVVDFTLTYLLKEKFKVNKYLSNAFGFFVAASSNFILNRYWTFASHDPQIGVQYFKFTLISIVGLLFSNLIILVGHDRLKLNFYLAKVVAISVVVLWNFSANNFLTFR